MTDRNDDVGVNLFYINSKIRIILSSIDGIMTGLIAIDESGDLGSSGTRYFTMAAIIMFRTRYLKRAADAIPNKGYEVKWNNSDNHTREMVLNALSDLNFKIVYYTLDKNYPEGNKPIYGNDLYEFVLRQIIRDSMGALTCKDVNVFLDSCSFVSTDRLRQIVNEEAKLMGANPKKVSKVSSQQNKCIQLADFVVGAVRANAEYSDETISVLEKKVSVARRH